MLLKIKDFYKRYKNWKILSKLTFWGFIIAIIGFFQFNFFGLPPFIDIISKANNSKQPNEYPVINAENVICDILIDSIGLTYTIVNDGEIPAHNIRYITKFNESYFGVMFDTPNMIDKKGKMTLYSIVKALEPSYIDSSYFSELYVIYDVKSKDKTETYYKKFKFSLQSLNTKSQTLFPFSSSNAILIQDISKFVSSITDFNTVLNRDDGSFFGVLNPDELPKNSVTILISGNDKRVIFNPFDRRIYLEKTFDNDKVIVISQELSNNVKELHSYMISWFKDYMMLIVDNKELVTDSLFRAQIKTHPAETYRDLGAIQFNNGEYEEAIRFLNYSISEKVNNDAVTYEKLFLSYEKTNKLDLGIKILEQAVSVGLKDSVTLINLALAYEKINNNERALELYELDTKYNKSHIGFQNQSLLLIKVKKNKEAEILCKRSLKIFPKSSELNNNCGVALLRQNNTKEALLYFEKAVKLDPNNINAVKNFDMLKKYDTK